MKQFFTQTLLLVCAFAAFSGCEDLPESAIRGYRATYEPNKAIDALQGSWSTACAPSGPYYVKDTVLFFGRQLSEVRRQFADSACSTTLFTLTVGKEFSPTSDENDPNQVFDVTVLLTEMGVSAGYAPDADSANLCGRTGWTDTTSVDVAGLNCLGVAVPALNSTGQETTIINSSDSITYDGTAYTRDES